MMELVKKQYRVCYQVNEVDKPIICNIKTADMQELHRVLVQMTQYEKPVRDWHDLLVHDITDTTTKEYGKVYIGLMYDENYNFKDKMPHIIGLDDKPLESKVPFFTKGLTRTARGISLKTKSSICFAPWMQLEDT